MGRSCNLLFALAVFILLHHHISLAIVPNISTNEAALLALKSHISSHRNNILARNCNNSFYGELPVKLAHLQRLKLISVTSNNFTGNIPSFLSLLPNLRFVYLSSNQFSGEIPSSLSNLTKLKELRIQNNFLKGEIPRGISDLHYLTILDLQLNELTGSIPTSIFNITMMQNIALTENNLTGQLPITICNHLPNLKGLHLSKNYLSGVIPPNIEKCRKLQILSLSLKEFIGTVPRELSNLTALTGLYISDLHLEVPSIFRKQAFSSISNSSKLRRIDLSINSFTGLIPESLGNLRYLEHLNLAGNTFFSDTTFSSLTPLTNCRNLRVLSFDGNQLDSTFPTSVGNFSNSSQTFTAPDCKLKGIIPKEIGNLTGVIHMSLH
ncbi:LRR receptor-like serine/threonine-protein kinase FLS2 [Capsicum annuum]|uniref:LRR receptor-like serine/threonine-protein kinase FLS2 n=1 Tax=Capsicum annuum TaxID=4072 RepID=UPI001FB1225A|nr:LRR receptor-like serine/threonine-protein kinase FLS2 [Capsicum annuum]